MLETLPPKRAALRDRVIEIAEVKAENEGISGLRARDLASEAGCALGSIYTIFGDLGDVGAAVNQRSFDQILSAMQQVGDSRGGALDVLKSLAATYAQYATDHTPRWKMAFETGLPEGEGDAALAPIIDIFVDPMAELLPAYSTRMVLRSARVLFATIHGITAMSLDPRLPVLPEGDLRRNLNAAVTAMVSTNEHV
ncbi:TetR/AcrR family transcriptional regulator [Actibacterium mucosum]|nr:TetR/AcrR family transcriptional regulator [Actibacterium mucosum]